MNRNIVAEVVGCEKPIRELVCDYMGVAGFASAGLRDARASCDYAMVIGFTSISKYYFINPKLAFGESVGIDWINEDGSYDPKIFERKKFIPPKRETVPEILNELSETQSMDLVDYIPGT